MTRITSVIAFVLLISYVLTKEIELEFDIPWPSGIMVDRVQHPQTNDIYRFGRLRHSTVGVRPEWSDVHIIENVISPQEGKMLIDRAEEYAEEHGWSKGRHVDYFVRPTKDLPFKTLFLDQPDAYHQWMSRFQSVIFPEFKKAYNISSELLYIDDFFITKYSSDSPIENALGPHEDKNPWSFVLALNGDFQEGGTYFVPKNVLFRPPVGSATIFHGYQRHGGKIDTFLYIGFKLIVVFVLIAYPIKQGTRYILAGFCNFVDDKNQEYTRFLTNYQPKYDGYAGSVGFHTGDLIIGVSQCTVEDDNGKKKVKKETQAITLQTSDEDWLRIVQSCEQLLPNESVTMRVKRFVRE